MQTKLPKNAKRVLALLANGEILKFHKSPQGYFKIASPNAALWSEFNRKTLLYSINQLYKGKLVNVNEGLDGTTKIEVLGAGIELADKLNSWLGGSTGPSEWDKRWRLVLFDVPENKKNLREAFRYHLRKLGFVEFRRSVFIFPFPCATEIESLADKFNLRDHIAMITAESISDEFHFKKKFNLL